MARDGRVGGVLAARDLAEEREDAFLEGGFGGERDFGEVWFEVGGCLRGSSGEICGGMVWGRGGRRLVLDSEKARTGGLLRPQLFEIWRYFWGVHNVMTIAF